jgi:hypothetical protein
MLRAVNESLYGRNSQNDGEMGTNLHQDGRL